MASVPPPTPPPPPRRRRQRCQHELETYPTTHDLRLADQLGHGNCSRGRLAQRGAPAPPQQRGERAHSSCKPHPRASDDACARGQTVLMCSALRTSPAQVTGCRLLNQGLYQAGPRLKGGAEGTSLCLALVGQGYAASRYGSTCYICCSEKCQHGRQGAGLTPDVAGQATCTIRFNLQTASDFSTDEALADADFGTINHFSL